MENKESLICGCLICNGNCKRIADRRRCEEIMVTGNESIVKSLEHRKRYRKLLRTNMQVIDCSIIYKQLKRILHDKEN